MYQRPRWNTEPFSFLKGRDMLDSNFILCYYAWHESYIASPIVEREGSATADRFLTLRRKCVLNKYHLGDHRSSDGSTYPQALNEHTMGRM